MADAEQECMGRATVSELLQNWQHKRWVECTNHMQLEIAKGNSGRAHAILAKFIRSHRREEISFDSSIWALELLVDVGTLELLERHGFETVRELAAAREIDLREIVQLGEVRIAKLKSAIETLLTIE